MRLLGFLLACGAAATTAASCGDPELPATDPGALVKVTTTSQVGVLLDEFPASSRDRVAQALLAKPAEWWVDRAEWQLRLTSVRLVYRKSYFDEEEQDQKNALPLPPEEVWRITLDPAGPQRTTVDGHDVVTMGYSFESVLVTDVESPRISEPALASIGGSWDEEFVFPVDPTLLFQRTGYACMSEDQFPAESVDAEDAYRFYDDTCEVETPDEPYCHHTLPQPDESCVDALTRAVGKVSAALRYERIAWDEATAQAYRFGELTTLDAPDLKVLTTGEGLNDHRVKYKYIPPDHCAIVDGCVRGSGWRRLLAFDSHDHNVGGEPLHIGEVDYYVEGLGGELVEHNVYEISGCHNHYHFKYYGDFYLGDPSATKVQKMGFCLESTDRLSNNETSPIWTDYGCEYQGVSAGWGDLYGASLVCNWVDITDLDTSAGPVVQDLVFQSNPDGFLCEGELVTDREGNQVWEPTEFVSDTGAPVDRPACNESPGVKENDVGKVSVTVPQRGGFVTQACRHDHDLGPLRNCGFTMQPALPACTSGSPVTIDCTGGSAAQPQVVRICETSQVLGTGMDCGAESALANVVVEGASTPVSFTCPAARDASEPGGRYAIYTAPVWEPDGPSAVTCTAP